MQCKWGLKDGDKFRDVFPCHARESGHPVNSGDRNRGIEVVEGFTYATCKNVDVVHTSYARTPVLKQYMAVAIAFPLFAGMTIHRSKGNGRGEPGHSSPC
jgi:hypothetical protein